MIVPGELFEIEVSGQKIQVRCLSLRDKRKLVAMLKQVSQAERSIDGTEQVYALVSDALAIACGDTLADQLLDRLDDRMAMEVINKTLAGHVVNGDQKKESASPPSSSAESCVNHAAVAASEWQPEMARP